MINSECGLQLVNSALAHIYFISESDESSQGLMTSRGWTNLSPPDILRTGSNHLYPSEVARLLFKCSTGILGCNNTFDLRTPKNLFGLNKSDRVATACRPLLFF